MTLTKVTDGLSLARMLLCPIVWSRPFHSRHAHRRTEGRPAPTTPETCHRHQQCLCYPSEVRSLELATQIYKQK